MVRIYYSKVMCGIVTVVAETILPAVYICANIDKYDKAIHRAPHG